MEQIAFIIITSGIGYIIHMMQRFDERLDMLDRRLLKMELIIPKRKRDTNEPIDL